MTPTILRANLRALSTPRESIVIGMIIYNKRAELLHDTIRTGTCDANTTFIMLAQAMFTTLNQKYGTTYSWNELINDPQVFELFNSSTVLKAVLAPRKTKTIYRTNLFALQTNFKRQEECEVLLSRPNYEQRSGT